MAETDRVFGAVINKMEGLDFLEEPETIDERDAYMRHALTIVLENLRLKAAQKKDTIKAAKYSDVYYMIKDGSLGVIVFGDPRRQLKIDQGLKLQELHPFIAGSQASLAFVLHRSLWQDLWESSRHQSVGSILAGRAELINKRVVKLKSNGDFIAYNRFQPKT